MHVKIQNVYSSNHYISIHYVTWQQNILTIRWSKSHDREIHKIFHKVSLPLKCIKFFFYFQIFAVQHVDVCMFSNGKFKNVVADINESHEIRPGELHRKVYSLLPIKGNDFVVCRQIVSFILFYFIVKRSD